MYLNYYGFKREPFQITPDPEFLFLSPTHKEAMASIIYGIEEKKGFVAIFGGVGVGKTTILRAYLDKVNREQARLIYIFNANLSFKSLLVTIYQDLGVPISSNDIFLMVNRLHEVLVEEYKQKHTIVLIIDEAQNMPVETLENLRMLSNLETATDKLIQIVLIGQPEFEDNLNRHELRQLKQRVAIRATILPLTQEESLRYIEHRLSKAMARNAEVLTKGAARAIARLSGGIPRVINILCDNAFITGYGYQKKPVTAKIVREISRDFTSPTKAVSQEPKHGYYVRWKTAAALLLLAAATGAFLLSPYKEQTLDWAQGYMGAKRDRPAPQRAEAKLPKQHLPVRQAVAVPEEPVAKEPPAALQPAAVADTRQPKAPAPPETKKPVPLPSAIVARGDTLSKLIIAKYGAFDRSLLLKVKRSNPDIKDVNKIYTGSTIVFPAFEDARADNGARTMQADGREQR
jgi:general secretion pathway protein A